MLRSYYVGRSSRAALTSAARRLCAWDARTAAREDRNTIARSTGQETRTSAPSMAFNQPGESPGLGNVTAQYPKVVTA